MVIHISVVHIQFLWFYLYFVYFEPVSSAESAPFPRGRAEFAGEGEMDMYYLHIGINQRHSSGFPWPDNK